MLPHDAPEEVFKARHSGLLAGLISSFILSSGGLVSNSGRLSATQAAVVVVLRVTVGVGQDYAILAGLWGFNAGG